MQQKYKFMNFPRSLQRDTKNPKQSRRGIMQRLWGTMKRKPTGHSLRTYSVTDQP